MNRLWDIIVSPLIHALKPKHIIEIGSENGFNTKHLLDYCVENNAKLSSIDPFPLFDVKEFKEKYGSRFEMFEGLSLDVLPLIKDYDLVLLDGDHNWYTIYNELKLIEKDSTQDTFPFCIFHDVSWPYARRDLYYNPDNIPEEFTNPYAKKGMFPGKNDLLEKGGMNNDLNNAINENTPKNGVLTGIEDFLNETDLNLTFKKINAFNGLGLMYPHNDDIDEIISNIVSNSDIPAVLEQTYLKAIITNGINYQKSIDNAQDIINQKEDLIISLTEEIKKRDSIINDLNGEINKRDIDIDHMNADMAKQNKKISNLNKKIDNLKNDITTKNDEIKNLKSKNRTLSNEMNEILSSNSWKFTKPLRSIKGGSNKK